MLQQFGVCLEVPVKFRGQDKNNKLFLFPSLGEQGLELYIVCEVLFTPSTVRFKFTIDKQSKFTFFGKQVKAKEQTMFVPALFTQLLVTVCQELSVSIYGKKALIN